MSRKMLAIFALTLVLAIAVAPATAADDQSTDNDDGYEHLLFTSYYLGSVKYHTDDHIVWVQGNSYFKLFFAEHADKVERFNKLIEDVKNNRASVNEIIDFEDDMTDDTTVDDMKNRDIVEYAVLRDSKSAIACFNGRQLQPTDIHIEPTVYTYLVEPGGTLIVKLKNVVGGNLYWRNHTMYDKTLIENNEATIHATKTTWIDIVAEESMEHAFISADVSVSGNSAPHDTPYALIAVCILITIGVAAIVVYAGLKPKWSK